MTAEHSNRPYFPALDGLRGLAILLVVLYHNFGFIRHSHFGWLGVDLFFVLSGFLITGILIDTVNKKNFLRSFYMKRVLRIFPLYYLCLIVFLIILPQIASINPLLEYYTDNQWWMWTYLQNWLFIFKPGTTTDALHHMWSLAVEEQFYLFWPLIILLVRKPKWLLVLLSLALCAVIATRYLLWVYQIENLAYYNLYTFSRMDGICIGSMLALVLRINPEFLRKYTSLIIFALAGFNFLFFFVNRYYDFTFPYLAIVGYTTFAVMFAIVVYEAVRKENRLVEFAFNNGFMRFFGKISYGLYVYHWPIYVFLSGVIVDWYATNVSIKYSRLLSSGTCSLIALVVSVISYRYFEQYFLKMKKRF